VLYHLLVRKTYKTCHVVHMRAMFGDEKKKRPAVACLPTGRVELRPDVSASRGNPLTGRGISPAGKYQTVDQIGLVLVAKLWNTVSRGYVGPYIKKPGLRKTQVSENQVPSDTP
jgi:hypothetical protein